MMNWFFYALLSALFAALTAIFAKAGLQGIDSDFATFIRTVMIVFVLALWVSYLGKWHLPLPLIRNLIMKPERLQILIIGNEILSGRRRDVHFANTLAACNARGLRLHAVHYLGDDGDALIRHYRRALNA